MCLECETGLAELRKVSYLTERLDFFSLLGERHKMVN
jgi:hypothetical protein